MFPSKVAQVLGALMIGALFALVVVRGSLIDVVKDIPAGLLPVILLVSAAALVALGLQFRAIAAAFGVTLSLREWLGLTAVNTMVSYAVPARGGVVVRALYLIRVHQMSIPRYAALTATALGSTLTLAAATGLLVAASTLSGSAARRAVAVFAATIGVLVGLTLAAYFASAVGRRLSRFAGLLGSLRDGMLEAYRRPNRLAIFVFWTAAFFVMQGLRLWISLVAVDSGASLNEVLVIHSGAALAFVISITPGSLGIKEGVIAFMAGLIGLDVELALIAALIDRAAAVIVTFAVGFFLGPGLAKLAARSQGQGAEERETVIKENPSSEEGGA